MLTRWCIASGYDLLTVYIWPITWLAVVNQPINSGQTVQMKEKAQRPVLRWRHEIARLMLQPGPICTELFMLLSVPGNWQMLYWNNICSYYRCLSLVRVNKCIRILNYFSNAYVSIGVCNIFGAGSVLWWIVLSYYLQYRHPVRILVWVAAKCWRSAVLMGLGEY